MKRRKWATGWIVFAWGMYLAGAAIGLLVERDKMGWATPTHFMVMGCFALGCAILARLEER